MMVGKISSKACSARSEVSGESDVTLTVIRLQSGIWEEEMVPEKFWNWGE